MQTKLIHNLGLTIAAFFASITISADTIPDTSSMQWRIGLDAAAAFVPSTNAYLKGNNPENKSINSTIATSIRCDFSFNPNSRQGLLYRGLYQGIGIEMRSFLASDLLGSPTSVYIYQGAPFLHFNSRLSLGYEWQFGIACGWKHYEKGINEQNIAVSTSTTAHMALGLKLNYQLSSRWQASFGIDATHFSNGNTSWPNKGINAIGANIGLSYIINPQPKATSTSAEHQAEADHPEWIYDIVAYGAWRTRSVFVNDQAHLCPGEFGVAGLQFSPMRKFNRLFAAGAAIDIQYDESAGLAPYWVEGTFHDNIKFYRPPLGKQISVGLSAHAELIMPIFALNAGIGYDIVSPQGNKRFYQSLTLKTFLHRNLYLNTGYRLGNFKEPQNLMLGVGLRL